MKGGNTDCGEGSGECRTMVIIQFPSEKRNILDILSAKKSIASKLAKYPNTMCTARVHERGGYRLWGGEGGVSNNGHRA